MSQLRLALPLALTVAIAPFALDTYLPAFPAIAASLGVTVHQVSLSVSVYVAALAVGQLSGGPLGDRYGRQVIMLAGLVVFALVSLMISQVSTLNELLVLRAVQAFAGGWVVVCVPAMVRDHVQGVEAAKLFSMIGLIMVAAPAIAPSIGSAFLTLGGWGTIFIFLGLYSLAAIIVLKRTLFARQPLFMSGSQSPVQDPSSPSLLQRYFQVITTPSALRYIFLQGLLFSVMMIFVTHASFIYQQHFGASAQTFSLLFGANILAMWVIMMTNRLLLTWLKPRRILTYAVTLQGVGLLLLLIITQLFPVLWAFVPAMMITLGAMGATSPNCQACYMEHFSRNSGTAAALMGAMQFGLAGLISTLSTLLPESIQSVVLAQAACSAVALCLVWWPERRGD